MTVIEHTPPRIRWYRCRVSREDLSRLNRRSNLLGLAQTLGFLLLLGSTAAAAHYSFHNWPWYATVAIAFVHGTFWRFLVNGFHELVHKSVFRTPWLNGLFVRIFAFLSWNNPHWFWASHTEHHKYTLHQPDDLEVVLPTKITLGSFLLSAFVDVRWLYHTLRTNLLRCLGVVNPSKDPWTAHLFPETVPQQRRALVRWSRTLVLGHGLIVAGSLYMGWWMVPVVVTLAPAYGGWLHFLLNNSQHAGLADKTPDYRLCCRTLYLNPFLQFLYWHMNYHTEHHMFPAVPCYNLPRLHRLIRHDMPPCPRGIIRTWRQIIGILRRQKVDPTYQYVAPLPPPAAASAPGDAVPGVN